MPGIMMRTMHDATKIKAWSPDWYHWLRFSEAVVGDDLVSECRMHWVDVVELPKGLTGITAVGRRAIERGRGPEP